MIDRFCCNFGFCLSSLSKHAINSALGLGDVENVNAHLFHLFRDIGLIAVGAVLGFIGSFVMWGFQLREVRRQKKADRILRAVHLATTSLSHLRSLLYSKTQGIKGVLNLPENPVDELMAIATLFLREIEPLVQRLHDKQQELFAHGIEGPDAADSMIQLAEEFPPIVNQIMSELRELSKARRIETT